MPGRTTPLRLLLDVPEQIARALWKRQVTAAWEAWQRPLSSAAAEPPTLDVARQQLAPLDGETYDVAVIGGGIVGSCTAYELSKRNQKCILLEQYDFLHRRGSSHGDSRIVRRTYVQDHFTAMMGPAYRLWAAAQEEGQTCVYTRTGGLDFGRRDNPALQSLRRACEANSVPHEVLTPAQVAERFPGLQLPADHIAIYSADSGILNATKAVALFQRLAAARGATLRDRTAVRALEPAGATGVRLVTDAGTITASRVVLCAGPWTGKLLQQMGLPHVADVLKPVAATFAYWRCGEQFSASRFPVFLNYVDGDPPGPDGAPPAMCYGFPSLEQPGLMKVCLHLPQQLHTTVRDADARRGPPDESTLRAHVAPFIRRFFRGVTAEAPALVESCTYTMTSDEDFVLDQLPAPWGRVTLGSACSGHGFKLAPLTGALLAELAAGGGGGSGSEHLAHFTLAERLRRHAQQPSPPAAAARARL